MRLGVIVLLATVTLSQCHRRNGTRGDGAPGAAKTGGRRAASAPSSHTSHIVHHSAGYVPPTGSHIVVHHSAVTPTGSHTAITVGHAVSHTVGHTVRHTVRHTVEKSLIPNAKTVRSCVSLKTLALPGNTTVESAAFDPVVPHICRVTAISTHPPLGDRVTIWVALPTVGWNGRFMGTGGGGFTGGASPDSASGPVAEGYVTAGTDTGNDGSPSFAIGADGKPQWQLIRDFGHVGIHEMTVTAKALTEALFGVPPARSYFDGCSTGGRQGQMEVQKYPMDYDGVISGSPAVNWEKLHPAQMWGIVLMNAQNNTIPRCKLHAATTAAINACDSMDGVTDGIIEDPERCKFDPRTLIGKNTTSTERGCGAVTAADASIIQKMWDGPRLRDGTFLWYGLPRGAFLTALWGSEGSPLRPHPFSVTEEWFQYFLTLNTHFDAASLTPDLYERLFEQSVEQYASVIGTDNPDLTAFRDRGGKTIVWHGWADPLISAQGTIDYYKRVAERMGGADKTSQFMRLYMAPGVGHCGNGPGSEPTSHGLLDSLLGWVEGGVAPETLAGMRWDQAGVTTRTRPLCQYPLVAKYDGKGSTDVAASYTCSAGF